MWLGLYTSRATRDSGWSIEKYDLSTDHIYGHYDWADTSCPGSSLRNYLENGTFKKAVENRLDGK